VGPGAIEVDLPGWVGDFVAAAAERVRHLADEPGTVAFERVFSPVDDTAEHGDPVATFERQAILDDLGSTVEATATDRVLSDHAAEAWLKVLGIVLATRAAELDVRTEDDREALSPRDQQFFVVIHALQAGLLQALESPPGR
jgi:hypothetical protein